MLSQEDKLQWEQATKSALEEMFKYIHTLLLAMVCLILAAPANVFAEEGVAANPEAATVPCKGLKPYNNLDELLYQFYINLESDCLFKMPLEELEKIWGIRIHDTNRSRRDPEYLKRLREEGYMFDSKPYKSEKDAFYLKAYIDNEGNIIELFIKTTKEYRDKYGTLLADGQYPKLLPPPIRAVRSRMKQCRPEFSKYEKIGEIDTRLFAYHWLNSDKTRIIYFNDSCGVNGISIRNKVPSFFLNASTR